MDDAIKWASENKLRAVGELSLNLEVELAGKSVYHFQLSSTSQEAHQVHNARMLASIVPSVPACGSHAICLQAAFGHQGW